MDLNIKQVLTKLDLYSNSGAWGHLKSEQFALIVEDVSNILKDSGLETAQNIDVGDVLESNKDLSTIVQENFLTTFVSIKWPEIGISLIDNYLSTYGSKINDCEKAYLNQLNRSQMGLYEVVKAEGLQIEMKSCVDDRQINLQAKQDDVKQIEEGDILAYRPIEIDSRFRLLGGHLVFSENQFKDIKDVVIASLEGFNQSFDKEYGQHDLDEGLKEKIYNQCLADWFLQLWLSMFLEKIAYVTDYVNNPENINGSELISLQFKIKENARHQTKSRLGQLFVQNDENIFLVKGKFESLVTVKENIVEFSVLSRDNVDKIKVMVEEKMGDLLNPNPILSYENVGDIMSGLIEALDKEEGIN